MDAHDRPGAAGEAVGVAAIQLVLVVEEDAPVARCAGRGVKITSASKVMRDKENEARKKTSSHQSCGFQRHRRAKPVGDSKRLRGIQR